MPINILMPALSPTMEKGNLTRWLKREGDAVKPGDVLAEIETDKATMEIEAVEEGILAKILVPEGSADVPVNDVIALIAAEGEDPEAMQGVGSPAPATAKPPSPPLSPVTAPAAPAVPASPSLIAAPKQNGGVRLFASPLARRSAREAGLEIATLKGSGPEGRIIERDVKAALSSGSAIARPAPSADSEAIKRAFAPDSYVEVPHDTMRKTIARRLVEAVNTIPHFYLTVDCEIDELLKLREKINKSAPKAKDGTPAYKISVNDMIIKALAQALVAVPNANVTFTENAMLRRRHADIAVAVAIPEGLITPVVRQADTLRLSAISNAMKDFAARAKARKLKPEEYQGGVSAVSNLGMYGIKEFAAVINPPQSSILAVGAGEARAIVKNSALVAAQIMSATMSFDHRAIDGATGAELIAAFKRFIEDPLTMLIV